MRRKGWALLALLLTGCGIQPSEVQDAGEAPTGVAPGVTLYFVDDDLALTPDRRETGRLGTISEALTLLLAGPGGSGLNTQIVTSAVNRVVVSTSSTTIQIMVPFDIEELPPLGIDQIVCTALGVHVQSGGSVDTRVRLGFIQPTPASDLDRTCPLME